MGSIGASKVNKLLSKLDGYDSRYATAVKSVAEQMHREFPELNEITTIMVSDAPDGHDSVIASMNGLGMLELNSRYFKDYEELQRRLENLSYTRYLAGDGSLENTILAHEFAHNLDNSFGNLVSRYAPGANEPATEIRNERWAEAYSHALGRKVNVGDTVTDIPGIDSNKKFLKIGNKTYSYHEFPSDGISRLIVPTAIQNVQKNWKKLGFATQPTERELVSSLSRYSALNQGTKNYAAEIFAESYASHRSYGSKANVLAQEVMRLTNQAYKQITSNKSNGSHEFYTKLYAYTAKMRKSS